MADQNKDNEIAEMALRSFTSYSEYPRSKFPEELDDWDNMEDLDSATAPLAEEYNELFQAGQYEDAAQMLADHPELDATLFNAYKFNQLMDGIKAVEKLFLDDIEDYVYEVFNHTIGINDDMDTENVDEMHTNTYSAYKIMELVDSKNLGVVVNLDLRADDWPESEPYTQTFSVSGVTSDTVFCPGIVYPDDCSREQQKAINKAAGYICSIETGTNSITVTATGRPVTDFTLGCVGTRG